MRGFLAGVVRKKLGLTLQSEKTDSERVYLTAPLDDGGDVSLLAVGQARGEAVPVVNRRDPRATRRALTADAASRAGGAC